MDVTSRQQSAGNEGRLSLLTEQAVSKLLQSPPCFDIFQTPNEPKDQQLCYLKWKWNSLSPVRLCDPMDCTVHEILQARILEWVAFPFSRGIFPNQRSNPGLPRYRWIIYPLRHKWSLRILEWGSLSLLQQIFLTLELNQGLLHCRQILYQLSYEGKHS